MRHLSLMGVAALVAAAWVSGPRLARACGGFFCSQPPPDGSLPIAQAAENVLFVMDTDANGVKRVEAHVQILYTGPASEFSWIVPVTAVPTVDVGWDVLFDRIEPPTRPSFQVSYQIDGRCSDLSSDSQGCGSGAVGSAGVGITGTGGGSGSINQPPVEVIARGSVGPFDYVVVRSEDGATLRTWLDTNGYFVSDAAARLVDEYVAGGFSFVAVKLQQGQDTSAIRPIILRMTAPEACLPLKLTAIAATPDLRINVWVLAGARAVPINFTEIGINLARIDWFNFGQNYDQLVKEAANEARGNAFVVEYARGGRTGVAWFTTSGVRSSLADATTPLDVLGALRSNGFQPTGALLQVLRKHIPLPAAAAAQGATEGALYTNPWSFSSVSLGPFDKAAFMIDLEASVLGPLDTLRPTFERVPYLTRLGTFISPDEMNVDPLFVPNASLPEVAPQHMAVGHVMCGDEDYASCNAPLRLEIEDGRSVWFQSTGACQQYTRGALDQMPASDVGFRRDADGQGTVEVDNRPAIDKAVSKHNSAVGAAIDGCGCTVRGRTRARTVLGFVALALLALGLRRRATGSPASRRSDKT
jgi:hypothetical protein